MVKIAESITQDSPSSAGPKISAIVVTFNPGRDVVENVKSLLEQVSNVIVIDNASNSSARDFVENLQTLQNVTVVYRENNGGIAAALNEGVRLARSKGADWIGTFDQDSMPMPSMVAHMLLAYQSYHDKENVAILAPTYRDNEGVVIRNFFADEGAGDRVYTEVMTVMTSGNLVHSTVFDKVGLFNESFFIDYVDHEFCLRCKSAGLAILQVSAAMLLHGLGQKTSYNVFGRVISVTNHSPLRRYYITRNRLYTYVKFARIYPAWVRADMIAFVKESARLLIFEGSRLKKILAMIRGMTDAAFGKTGQYAQRKSRFP